MANLSRILFGRRTLAIVIAIVMVLQLLPVAALAEDADVDAPADDVTAVETAAETGTEAETNENGEYLVLFDP